MSKRSKSKTIQPTQIIEPLIRIIRGQKVILDSDLAIVYGVTTKRLNEQVQRNRHKFPDDFVFRLNAKEMADLNWSKNATSSEEPFDSTLRSQNATSKDGRGGRRYLPYAFTEHGAIMAANVLNSPSATQMSVFVVRAFVRLRQVILANKELAAKLAELESKVEKHDESIQAVFEAIKQLMTPLPATPKRRIGFHPEP